MKLNKKHSKGMMIGSIVSGVAGIFALIIRFGTSAEMNSIKNSYAAIVQVGAEQMTKSEYLEYASSLVTTYTLAAVALLILAAILFFQRKQINNQH